MKMSVIALTLTLSITALAAQDPVTVLPDAYSNQFENEWVRVVRVRYAPHARLPAHAHNARPFKHVGTSYGAATRPATKVGSFRVFRGIDEIHEVENTSELPSEFLRVEFKTDPKDVRTLKGKFFRPSGRDGHNLEHVQFENDQVRITHVIGAPGRSLRLSAGTSEPALLIAFEPAQLREKDADVTVRPGQERWMPAGSAVTYENLGSRSSEFLRFDFKTTPTTSSIQR